MYLCRVMDIVYEDNHLLIVNKHSGEIVQGDKTGDEPMVDALKRYLKEKYAKPGNVFLGVVHRLDRPVSGLVVFARTSKALSRLNEMFRKGEVHKTYWAIVPRTAAALPDGKADDTSVTLHHWLTRNTQKNVSRAHDREVPGAKEALLRYRLLSSTDRYMLLEVHLLTGRHHQIRCQLAKTGMPIKGDLKYGAPRSNPDGSISLMARHISFIHPVTKLPIELSAEVPEDNLWKALTAPLTSQH